MRAILALAIVCLGVSTGAQARICRNDSVSGVVLSENTIGVHIFTCKTTLGNNPDVIDTTVVNRSPLGFPMEVLLKNPGDLVWMIFGNYVKLKGDFRLDKVNGHTHIAVSNAELMP